ncbi:MAG: hypothetical protein EOO69_09520 [Moraxellaceae bacterium]|nr:MAG: hypothetical protein EOO69_09520 [Moraxellaceae bacterium]
MAKKLSGRTLATSLIPNRLHKTEFDPDCNLNVRYPFYDDDQVILSFQEVVDMLELARQLGQLEVGAGHHQRLNTGLNEQDHLNNTDDAPILRPVKTKLVNITRRLLKKAS